MSESETHVAIEAIARNSYGRLIAYIAARSGDVAGAEDVLATPSLQHWSDGRGTASRKSRRRGCCMRPAIA